MVSPLLDLPADNLLYPAMVRPHFPEEQECQASMVCSPVYGVPKLNR
jgi:hypothetical protein